MKRSNGGLNPDGDAASQFAELDAHNCYRRGVNPLWNWRVGIGNAYAWLWRQCRPGDGKLGGKVVRNMHHEGSNSGRGLPDPLTAPALTRYRGYHRAWPLLVVMAVYASLSADAIAQPGVSADRAALVALYNATGGENWTRKTNWSSSVPVGEWSGVTTDGDGRVTRLNLNNRNLTGPLPPELGTMAHLTGLFLSTTT